MYPQEQETQTRHTQTYYRALLYTSAGLIPSYPLDRIRFAIQTTPGCSAWGVTKSYLMRNYHTLYDAASFYYLRQWNKSLNRTFNIIHVAPWIDSYQFHILLSCGIKSMGVTLSDILTTVPLDNCRAQFLHEKRINPEAANTITMTSTIKTMVQQHGWSRFYRGIRSTTAESYLSWFYFLISYEALKTTRDQTSFLSTIFWATCTSTPLVALTLPFESLKYRTQTLQPKPMINATLRETTKNIMTHSFFSWRQGGALRLLQKIITTAVGYGIMDANQTESRVISENSKNTTENTDDFRDHFGAWPPF